MTNTQDARRLGGPGDPTTTKVCKITLDDVGWTLLEDQNAHVPNLNRLMNEGLVFTAAHGAHY